MVGGTPARFDGGNHESHCQRHHSPSVRRFRTHRYRCGRTHRSPNAVTNVAVAEFDLMAKSDGFDRPARRMSCDLDLVMQLQCGDGEPI